MQRNDCRDIQNFTDNDSGSQNTDTIYHEEYNDKQGAGIQKKLKKQTTFFREETMEQGFQLHLDMGQTTSKIETVVGHR